ncbi:MULTISPECIES: AbrB/MazE/SpoVT family DNA-binding domain-containing protein [unclassified Methylobacterium]|uniref:AbrB/MazE/SpoVT family DNA-binding domain-containing protein n=1 Tax=unclassified Methylobacterium TaxID=2615210 RepID=UPI0006F59053|nr:MULTISPECIES: AbrB/MazE/SpoVT family DNA-binding domain-containing protein [unclassified Methylobacterium]KQP82803.1 AbrB family transcriptional regulator [Methylobacterium sp. Leaf117]KQP93296.1 AbrB family transcriptional regulator [Methylobacterium sp. Leaf113]MCK2054804.1 AbrB/MazE/SpoVT family DNA-binding domain-containing protein [Methylobacterium sp. 37f]
MTGRDVLTTYSKVSVKSQTVLPAEVRERLGIGPGDRLRYVITPDGIRIEKARPEGEDPFVTFTEWAGAADEEAYGNL